MRATAGWDLTSSARGIGLTDQVALLGVGPTLPLRDLSTCRLTSSVASSSARLVEVQTDEPRRAATARLVEVQTDEPRRAATARLVDMLTSPLAPSTETFAVRAGFVVATN